MRRLIAFLVDFVIAFILSLFLSYILELITNRSLNNKYVIAIICILLISVFEFAHRGITPGRLLAGLSLVDINNKNLTINRIFRRNCLLVFFPFLANFVSDFFFDWVFQTTPLFVMDEVGSGWIIFCILFLSIFALTLGNQSFHDYVFDTVVISNNKKSKLRIASNGQVWLIVITILVLTIACATILPASTSSLTI